MENNFERKHAWRYVFVCSVTFFFTIYAYTAYASNRNNDSFISTPETTQQNKRITGRIVDDLGTALPGATVLLEGSTRGAIADNDGNFELEGVPVNGKIVISFIGMESQTMTVSNKTVFNIQLKPKRNDLEEVAVVAFAKQKKESVLASITTVKPAELKVPSSNLTTSLAGRVAGLISYQQSGEPGKDNAQFFIRGITSFGAKAKTNPLILIDGIELSADDLARLNTDDIASFSIMKDATATALYGARGANGVILVTTKEGKEGKAQVSFRLENSFSAPTRKIELADPVSYMKMHNESVQTRNPLGLQPYSLEKIAMTERGLYPDLYPTTNWYDYIFKDMTMNQRANFSVSGGGNVARYYVAASFAQDNGNLKMDKRNNFNSNIDLKKYVIRSNVNINITKTTEAVIRLHATFDDYTGPLDGGSGLYEKVMQANPVLFKPYYEPDANNIHTNHILFGNYGKSDYINPYAEMLKGYKDWSKTLMLAQFEVKQNFDFITKGLKGRFLFNTNRYSEYDVQRFYKPFFYNVKPMENPLDPYVLESLNPKEGTEYIDYQEGGKYVNSVTYVEAALEYQKTLAERHSLSGLLVYIMRQYSTANGGSLQASLPQRNLGLSGRFTYSYDSRYFGEFNFGYNGSERFSSQKRFGFFPSVGLAWYVSNEAFFEPLKSVITQLKLKGTYGLVGNDAIGDENDRFFYLSQIEMQKDNRSVSYGEYLNNKIIGVETVRYANDNIGWETSYKTNIGIELSLFDKFTMLADFFHDKRTNILIDRIVPASMGLSASKTTQANLGVATSKGVDIEANYQHNFSNHFWMTGRGTFTYANSMVTEWEEPDYSRTPWLSKVNQPIGQQLGYIAERLFIDDEDIKNSPSQFGEYMPGDIKYRDINGDGKISTLDQVPIGHPVTPEINYGFGLSAGYRGFDASVFFQGSGIQSFWIDTKKTSPFIDINNDFNGNNALLGAYANSYWSEGNPNIYALWPRLSNYEVENNQVKSTWFMQDATFIRLKSMEFGYTIPQKITMKAGISNLRVYLSGTNLLTWSRFKLWDPEMAGNGLGYPIQRVFNVGMNFSF